MMLVNCRKNYSIVGFLGNTKEDKMLIVKMPTMMKSDRVVSRPIISRYFVASIFKPINVSKTASPIFRY